MAGTVGHRSLVIGVCELDHGVVTTVTRKRLPGPIAVVLAVGLVAGCSGEGSGTASATGVPPSTTGSTENTTTTIHAATTAGPPTTTPLAPTTTIADLVTVDPYLPSAMGRSQVPWDEVGDGWEVVLYDSSRAAPTSEEDVRDGPAVLYLVDPDGGLYEIASWAVGQHPGLIDATPAPALVVTVGSNLDEPVYEWVDLHSGDTSEVATFGFQDTRYLNAWPLMSLTRPTGANVVVLRSDGEQEWLERRSADGTGLGVVYERPHQESGESLSWLYGYDGRTIVVGDDESLTLISNQGSVIRELSVPSDTRCGPVRFWDADTVLAVCYGQTAATAPLDNTGEPHTFFGRLWLIDVASSSATALTELPDQPPVIADFGYHDAWPADGEVLLQWSGDCGASSVAVLRPDGTGEFPGMIVPSSPPLDGIEMIDVTDDRITVYGWQGCSGDVGSLFTLALDGALDEILLSPVGDSRGVIGVRSLATVYSETHRQND